MTDAIQRNETWVWGGAAALIGHGAVLAGVLLVTNAEPVARMDDPVVLVEMAAEGDTAPSAAPAPAHASAQAEQQPIDPVAATERPPEIDATEIDAPTVREPLPRQIVSVPQTSHVPTPRIAASTAPIRPSAADRTSSDAPDRSATGNGAGQAAQSGDSARARKQEADYYALLAAHLNRKKRYPAEAKKARQQGVVTVRFTVHPDGAISNATIKTSSGHALLDQATLDLMQRVAPLPKFPKSMTKDRVTLALPIDYSLRTS